MLKLLASRRVAQARQGTGMRSPKNEVGFSMCRDGSGRLVFGPVATGTPTSVQIPVQCPPGASFEGLAHSHPGGIPVPSRMDVSEALRLKAKVLCIDADGVTKCYRPTRSQRGK